MYFNQISQKILLCDIRVTWNHPIAGWLHWAGDPSLITRRASQYHPYHSCTLQSSGLLSCILYSACTMCSLLLNFVYIVSCFLGDKIEESIYQKLVHFTSCVRLLNATHQIGCTCKLVEYLHVALAWLYNNFKLSVVTVLLKCVQFFTIVTHSEGYNSHSGYYGSYNKSQKCRNL